MFFLGCKKIRVEQNTRMDIIQGDDDLQVIKNNEILQMRQNKLRYICTKMQEFHKYMAWLNHEFDKLGIKCPITPAHVSLYLREFHDKAKEEEIRIVEQQDLDYKR